MVQAPDQHETKTVPVEPSPLTTPPERTRDRSADDLEVDIGDPNFDLTFDDGDRLKEDAHPQAD